MLKAVESRESKLLVLIILMGIMITGAVLVQSISGFVKNNTNGGSTDFPEKLVFTFKKIKPGVNVVPLFGKQITPVSAMEKTYIKEYRMKPGYTVGVYSQKDYIILLAGALDLSVEKTLNNDTHLGYKLALIFHNVSFMHFAPPRGVEGEGVLQALVLENTVVREVDFLGSAKKVYLVDRVVVETSVWVSKDTWDYTDGENYYGTWPFTLPQRPMALLIPVAYLETDPERMLGAVFLLENATSTEALPIHPYPWGTYTERLLEVARETGQDWIRASGGRIELNYRGKAVLPASAMVPYKLVYREDNVLEKITLSDRYLDHPQTPVLREVLQEDNAFLIPPPLAGKVGQAILLAPYEDQESMFELVLVRSS